MSQGGWMSSRGESGALTLQQIDVVDLKTLQASLNGVEYMLHLHEIQIEHGN